MSRNIINIDYVKLDIPLIRKVKCEDLILLFFDNTRASSLFIEENKSSVNFMRKLLC